MKHRPSNIRLLLLLPIFTCLIIPTISIIWLDQTKNYMSSIQQTALDSTSKLIAKNIAHQADLKKEILELESYNPTRDLIASPLGAKILLDGKATDWAETKVTRYGKSELVNIAYPYTSDSLQLALRLGVWEKNLYMLLVVKDEKVIYREVNNLSIHRNDHIRITTLDERGIHQRFVIAPYQPSTTSAYKVNKKGRALRAESRITSNWAASSEGYNVEIEIPISMLGTEFSISVSDVDNEETRAVEYEMGSGNIDNPGSLQLRSNVLTKILQDYKEDNITLLDTHERIIAQSGKLDQGSDPLFALWLDKGAHLTFISDFLHETVSYEIQSSRSPIVKEGETLGYLKVSQTNQGTKLLHQNFLHITIMISIITLLLSITLWIISSSLLTRRIRKITLNIERRVDSDGRVSNPNESDTNQDELGELSRSFSNIVNRLHQYNAYLEAMAGRLAHELRTPISVVKSSLESLSDNEHLASNTYLKRANNGVERLTNILNKMSEATRLEAALDEDEIDPFNVIEVVEGCIHGYEHAFPEFRFSLKIETESLIITGIPELIVQLMDKLISNATEFSSTDDVIGVRITKEGDQAVIRVVNEGPSLPEAMQNKLFDSMISVRKKRDASSSHLGLGLYIAKLIAHFHGGEIKIANREDVSGVIVTVTIPLMRLTTKLV
ncbi:MAG: two-component system sensor histidine kinase ChvG [Candidatus Azotimanducaceae bacterium]